ncbi:hypothetical protein UA08_06931 [Talaromyces atroroseus]|uniref:Stress-response A/B barrel domain-containing protein n=1 Tax=Talaromyces atroroseus TaxID=1441469 RepID=A0A225ASR1_TALAT|nr:hypothetical protein UA08_06931 [Talaromyces atroroseus]OKL57465.1 hypothetical protein UA08_06931 [Talaromyces atroroseus]
MPSRRQLVGVFVAFVSLCALLAHLRPVLYTTSAQHPPNMPITHIVLFQFKASTDSAVISDVRSNPRPFNSMPNLTSTSTKINSRMLALEDNCLHPSSQKPYIKSSSGGVDNSIKGIQNGITHAFVVEFASKEDRDFYVQSDLVHQGFIRSLDGIIEKAQVIDFADRVF